MKTPASMRGFSLMELMIVVIIVGILAAIAFPSYREHTRKARRAQAASDLGELAQNLERWHTINNTYATYTIPARLQRSPQQGPQFYTIAAVRAQNTFTLTATPMGAQTGDSCGNFTLNQAGTKGVSASSVEACW